MQQIQGRKTDAEGYSSKTKRNAIRKYMRILGGETRRAKRNDMKRTNNIQV